MSCARPLAWLLVLAASALAQEKPDRSLELKGRIVLADGTPVAGVAVAQSWGFDGGKPRPYFSTVQGKTVELRSGEDGRFAGRFLPWISKAFTVFAVTDDRSLCGFVQLDEQRAQQEIMITLVPAVRVHGRLQSTQLGGQPLTSTYVVLAPKKGGQQIAQCSSTNADFDLCVPPGDYGLRAYGKDLKDLRQTIQVVAGKDLDLGTLDVPGSFFALRRGQAIPEWKVTEARGIGVEQATIAGFRGKWLFVEFWGFW